MARGIVVKAVVAANLHAVALKWTYGQMRGLSTHLACLRWHQFVCRRSEPGKWKIRKHRRGPGEKEVGLEKVSLWRHSRGPPCSPCLCHPVASTGKPPCRGQPLEGCWCYVCWGCILTNMFQLCTACVMRGCMVETSSGTLVRGLSTQLACLL